MYAGFFDVFLNCGDDTGVFIGQRVHIKLRRAFKKFIDQNRTIGCEANCIANVLVETLFVINNSHRAAAQYVTGPHQHRITDLLRNFLCLISRRRHSVFRLWDAEFSQQRAKTFSVFSQVDCISPGADDGNARLV